jgi:hypothetical protein
MFLAENRAANQGSVRIAERHSDDVRGAARFRCSMFPSRRSQEKSLDIPGCGAINFKETMVTTY